MTDERARDLLVRAERTDAPDDWRAYLARQIDSGVEAQQAECARLLEQPTAGNKKPVLEALVRNGGVWIERDDAKSIVHVHGVKLSPKYGQPQEAYTMSWAQERLTTLEEGTRTEYIRFTQERAAILLRGQLHSSLLNLVLPTAPERDSTLRALIRAQEFGRQPELAEYVSSLMRSDYDDWCLTSDRVMCGEKGKLIRAYGREDRDEIPIDLPGGQGYARDLLGSQAMIQLLLGTDEHIAQVDDRYKRFLDVSNGAYFWSPRLQGECPLVLSRYNPDAGGIIAFGIVLVGDSVWPVRGCHRAKLT